MPDWSYRTLFRPALFALPAAWGRDVALVAIGTLARMPLGGQVIDFLGHMRPSPLLGRTVLGRRLCGPLGFAAELDPSGYALAGLARFGVGFVEIGPCARAATGDTNVQRDDQSQSIRIGNDYTLVPIDRVLARLAQLPSDVGAIVRLTADEEGEAVAPRLAQAIAERACPLLAVAIEARPEQAGAVARIANLLPREVPLLLTARADDAADALVPMIDAARASGAPVAGVLVLGTVTTGSAQRLLGTPARLPALALVSALRSAFPGEDFVLIAGGGVHEPHHALDLFAAGANLVHIDSGLVYSGPGLVKRIHEGLLAQQAAAAPPAVATEEPVARYAWFWILLMGLAMFCGGILALGIAGTRVVLPYDEHFVGMTRAELNAINPRLLAFMTHDRVTLAGTMLAVGVLYSGLAWHGMRRGYHWAWVAVMVSALTGFLSFFSFLGFGYFEPFHAFVTAVLFQLLLMAWHAPLGPMRHSRRVPLVEEWRWRLAQWGQLLLVCEALAVLTAGIVICIVGSTSVFVQEDLEFMETCSAALADANPRLLALVAHDRATFGGMLVACGLTTLMATLWGFAAGRSWLFSTLLFAGSIGYLCTLAVHFAVGYIDLNHLLPAFGGLAVHWLALALAGPYLLWREYRTA